MRHRSRLTARVRSAPKSSSSVSPAPNAKPGPRISPASTATAVLAGEILGPGFAFGAGETDEDDFGAERTRAVNLDLWRIVGHDDDCFHAQGASGVGDALSVVAAGVAD